MENCSSCLFENRKGSQEPCVNCVVADNGKEYYWRSKKEQDNPNSPTQIKNYITDTCEEIKNLLIEKNEAYGNSALDPIRIFSKADALEQINVRIDDKLSRIMRGKEYGQEDTELDLIGYLILKRAVKKQMIEEL